VTLPTAYVRCRGDLLLERRHVSLARRRLPSRSWPTAAGSVHGVLRIARPGTLRTSTKFSAGIADANPDLGSDYAVMRALVAGLVATVP